MKNLYPLTWNGNMDIPSSGNSSRENKVLIEVKGFLNCSWQTLFLQHFMIIYKLKMVFNSSKLQEVTTPFFIIINKPF